MAASAATVRSALASAQHRIDPVDARVLLCAALGQDPAYLIAHDDAALTREQALAYEAWVERRASGHPVAYLLGYREFYGRTFRVTPAVLIPRPETELLIDVVLPLVRERRTPRVLDLGTGSGCVALTLAAECAQARVTGVDRSGEALAVARDNAAALGLSGVAWRASDWFAALDDERYDVIVSNPPYIDAHDTHLAQGDLRFEPRAALTPGDGLAAIRLIVAGALRHLVPGGDLWFEHGYDQGAECRALLNAAGYVGIQTHRDLAGHERVSGGVRPGS